MWWLVDSHVQVCLVRLIAVASGAGLQQCRSTLICGCVLFVEICRLVGAEWNINTSCTFPWRFTRRPPPQRCWGLIWRRLTSTYTYIPPHISPYTHIHTHSGIPTKPYSFHRLLLQYIELPLAYIEGSFGIGQTCPRSLLLLLILLLSDLFLFTVCAIVCDSAQCVVRVCVTNYLGMWSSLACYAMFSFIWEMRAHDWDGWVG